MGDTDSVISQNLERPADLTLPIVDESALTHNPRYRGSLRGAAVI